MLYNNKYKKMHSKKEAHSISAQAHSHCDDSEKAPHIPYDEPAASCAYYWTIIGMDCANCARKIEYSIKSLPAIEQVRVVYSTEKLIVHTQEPTDETRVAIETRVRALGFDMHYHDQNAAEAFPPPYDHHPINKKDMFHILGFGALIGFCFILSGYHADLGQYAFTITTLLGLIPIVKKTVLLIRTGNPFSIETLMSLSALGALFIGAAEEASVVLFLFRIGEMLEAVAANKAKKGIASLIALMPEDTIKIVGNAREKIPSRFLMPGDIIEASSGNRLPADVILISPFVLVDERALTGESMPVEYQRGDKIMAGSLIIDKTVQLEVASKTGKNAVDRILQLIEHAEERKAPLERFIDRFSRYYTPAIMAISLLVIVIPPLFFDENWYLWTYKGLTLLLIGCPCALVVSTPASITSALSAAARQGVLIKGGAALEVLALIKIMVFDKTGTLTLGKPVVTDIIAKGISEKELLQKAAAVEAGSHHPLAKAIIDISHSQYEKIEEADNRQAIAGIGVKGLIQGENIALITPIKANTLKITIRADWQSRIHSLENEGKTVVMVIINSNIVGLIALQDRVRPEAAEAIVQLKQLGITSIMLTGDNTRSAKALAEKLKINYYAELLPIDKLKKIEKWTAHDITAMVGDGINDSPAIKAATIGIAMGTGSDVALETADAALTKDNLLSLPKLISLSRAANHNIRQNIIFALSIKALFLITTLLGITGLWIAVLADSGTTALVTANALRLLRFKPNQP